MKATLGDVAKAAGVSEATVDRVINRRGNVRPETELAVLEAARRLRLDRSLARAPVRLLRFNVVMHNSHAAFFQKLRRSFKRCQENFRHLNVVLNTFEFELEKEQHPTRAIEAASRNCDGLIYVGPDHSEAVAALQDVPPDCPIVTFATDIPGSRRAAYFGLDNYAIGRLAGDLMGRFTGDRPGKVLLLIGLNRYVGHRQREAGFRSVLAERFAGLTISPTFETRENPERAVQYLAAEMRRWDDIVGIYNSSNGNRTISDLLVGMKRQDVVFINHEISENTRSHLASGTVDVIIDHNTDNDCLNAIEYLLFCNHLIEARDMLNRNNLDLFFRETANRSLPAV